jgi:hypothetical protein
MKLCAQIMRGQEQPTQYRLKAAEVILARAVPKANGNIGVQLGDSGMQSLRIESINSETKASTVEHETNADLRPFEVTFSSPSNRNDNNGA